MTAAIKGLESMMRTLSEEHLGELFDFAAYLLYKEQKATGVWDEDANGDEDEAPDEDVREKIHRGMREPLEWATPWEALREDV